MGFKSVSKWFIDAATGLLKPIGGALGVTFGPGSSVQDDGTGELTIKTETAGKYVFINGKVGVSLKTNGAENLKLDGEIHLQPANYIRINSGKELRTYNAANTVFGSIWQDATITKYDSPGYHSILIGGASKFHFKDSTIESQDDNIQSLGTNSKRFKEGHIVELFTGDIDLQGVNGSKQNNNHVTEEFTIVAGTGAGGVLTTAFIPAGRLVKRVVGRVIQAPGGGATDFDACINGDGNKSLGDTIAVALNTTFDNLVDGDGNRSNPWGQQAAVAIKITTDNNVTGSDMIVRIVVFYEAFTPPTS